MDEAQIAAKRSKTETLLAGRLFVQTGSENVRTTQQLIYLGTSKTMDGQSRISHESGG